MVEHGDVWLQVSILAEPSYFYEQTCAWRVMRCANVSQYNSSSVVNTPVTPNAFLLRSSERAQTVCELPEHSTNNLNGLGHPEL